MNNLVWIKNCKRWAEGDFSKNFYSKVHDYELLVRFISKLFYNHFYLDKELPYYEEYKFRSATDKAYNYFLYYERLINLKKK